MNAAKGKWDRLINPKTTNDYGLILTQDELSTFPEGVEILQSIHAIDKEDQYNEDIMAQAGLAAKNTIDNVFYEILTNGIL